MYSLSIRDPAAGPLKLLCLGAHADDIEIGCGGLLLSLLQRHHDIEVDWVVFSAGSERKREARDSAELFLRGARRKRVLLKHFPDGFFPFEGGRIKSVFEVLKKTLDPDIVLTHYRDDRHQDHRMLSDLTWNTFRDHLILQYEIPKFDGDLGIPNWFVPLDAATCSRKVEYWRPRLPASATSIGSPRRHSWD